MFTVQIVAYFLVQGMALWWLHRANNTRPWNPRLPTKLNLALAVGVSLLPVVLFGLKETNREFYVVVTAFSLGTIASDLSVPTNDDKPRGVTERLKVLTTDEVVETAVLFFLGYILLALPRDIGAYWPYLLAGFLGALRISRMPYLLINLRAARAEGHAPPLSDDEFARYQWKGIVALIPLSLYVDSTVQALGLNLNNFNAFATLGFAVAGKYVGALPRLL